MNMPGQLNPNKNLFSVAPVGGVTIIGHSGGLKMGLTRDRALNLIAWLTIATNATPEEVKAEMDDARSDALPACRPAPQIIAQIHPSMPAAAPIRGKDIDPKLAAQIAAQMEALNSAKVPGGVASDTSAFIGDLDPEEAAAIDAVVVPGKVG
jgi:hypothetical protein